MIMERVFSQPIVVLALSLVLGVAIGSAVSAPLLLAVMIFVGLILVNLYLQRTILTLLTIVAAGVAISTFDVGDRVVRGVSQSRLTRYGVEKVESLGLSEDSEALVEAVVLGQRGALSQELIHAYRFSGASHLLAISGLHVGMVVLLLAFLLRPIVLFPFGNIALDLVSTAFLWLYAVMAGGSTSVVRATIMLSVLLLSKILSGRYSPMRSLAFAVIIMVMIDPSIIFSVGFQLSVIAVLAILLWAVPIIKALHQRVEGCGVAAVICEYILSSLLIGVVCCVATLPVVLMNFGYIVWWGAILNPIVITLSYLIVSISLVWLLLGFEAISEPFRWLIDTSASLQNRLLMHCSSEWCAPLEMRLSELDVALIYAIYITLTIIAYLITSPQRDAQHLDSSAVSTSHTGGCCANENRPLS